MIACSLLTYSLTHLKIGLSNDCLFTVHCILTYLLTHLKIGISNECVFTVYLLTYLLT